ncbi:MAG TPA: xanthine dehydrogenase family protein molybdopterin-binding subunit, partial [Bryobacteraceae bacterium]|nr:xanthine dehydrogenase family protein molybdopterin-binding subunit [Bryobacteraceae bacterium]
RYAASLLDIEYARDPHATAFEQAGATAYKPEKFMSEDLQLSRGDVERALREADVTLDATYITPTEHACAMEPHAAIASWSNGALTVYNSTQWVMGDAGLLAAALDLPREKVTVLCPFTGGMFGSKATTGAHVMLAALASQRLKRPVRAVLTREQVLVTVGHRPKTVQRVELGARRDGTLIGLRHHTTSHTAVKDEFIEPVNITSRHLYPIPNFTGTHEAVRVNVMKPAWMRAPGEAPCQYAIESALDEISYELAIDPVELRQRNHATHNVQTGKPYSSKHLLACYERGAERFGWSKRPPRPRSLRDGDALLGWGMATATYPGYTMGATVRVRLEGRGADARATVSTAGSDVGTGMYTMLAVTAADRLRLPIERVTVQLGDSQLAQCAFAGGSNLTSSTAPAVADACEKIKQKLLTQDGSRPIEAEASTQPILGQNDQFAFQSFGAHFVEVRVEEDIGRIRVSRVVSVFDCGRILSVKTTRSQFIGGIVFGIGAALLEHLVYDREHGRAANADLAGYLVPVNADVPDIDVSWIDEPDLNFNSLGCRGVGEIGITGVAAAIANAVYHATGVRVRDLPITPDRLLGL